MSLRVFVQGASGRMGQAACAAVEAAEDLELVGRGVRGENLAAALASTGPDVLVEFTVGAALPGHLRAALDAGVPVVSGTTGFDRAEVERLAVEAERRGIAFLLAPNFAIGVLLMQRFARQAARWFDQVEILELHHERKLDAPSGTAIDTARQIAASADGSLNGGRPDGADGSPARGQRESGIPLHSVRLPGLLAHQEVLFGAAGQCLRIRHDTSDREAFMPGVLLAIRQIRHHTGLLDSLEILLASSDTEGRADGPT